MKSLLTSLALLLVLALVLSGAHAKDLAAMPHNDINKVAHEDATTKSYGELHSHVDKQTGKNLSGDNPLADNRSLRTREKHNQDIKKVVSKLIKDWQQNLFLSLA